MKDASERSRYTEAVSIRMVNCDTDRRTEIPRVKPEIAVAIGSLEPQGNVQD